jgi:tetratricopeptide (TPR) repeat protein
MDPAAPADSTTTGLLREARDALGRHAWQDAFGLFSRSDQEATLSAKDLESLAEAAWFTAQPDRAMEALERAFKAHPADGDRIRAAWVAISLAEHYVNKRKFSIASAWKRRAEQLLENEEESYAHGYLALADSHGARERGDVDAAIERAERAIRWGAEGEARGVLRRLQAEAYWWRGWRQPMPISRRSPSAPSVL